VLKILLKLQITRKLSSYYNLTFDRITDIDKILLDNLLLSYCDQIITTSVSTFGTVAALRHGIVPLTVSKTGDECVSFELFTMKMTDFRHCLTIIKNIAGANLALFKTRTNSVTRCYIHEKLSLRCREVYAKQTV
jgi:hypothetical protein